MTAPRDDEADDAFVDHCLQQELGGERPPDLADRVAASPERWARAAAAVDAAATPERLAPRRFVLAAAAVLVIGGALAWLAPRAPAPPVLPPAEALQALLDEFHRVMPSQPELLRDADCRRDIAPQALPVLRRMRELHDLHPGNAPIAAARIEFDIYAAMLGDDEVVRALRAQAAGGDDIAGAALAVVAIGTGERAVREQAVLEFADRLRAGGEPVARLVRTLVAVDLTLAEADQIARAIAEPAVGEDLRRIAERTASGARSRIGHSFALLGRLVDDSLFRTESLQGRPVLVCYWATWCEPSLAALDEIRRLAKLHPELAVVAVSGDHDAAALRGYLAEHPDRGWYHCFDSRRPGLHESALDLGIRTLPTVLLLDRDGIVDGVYTTRGIDRAVQRLLRR